MVDLVSIILKGFWVFKLDLHSVCFIFVTPVCLGDV